MLFTWTGNLKFWSDPHFGHKNILKYCPRPYADLVEMERALIANYNAVVGPRDTCVWGGDCFFLGTTRAKEIMSKLNGRKVLVRGNHDQSAEKMLAIGFDEVYDKLELLMANRTVKVCHFPYKPKTDDIDIRVLNKLQQLKAEARATGNDSKKHFTEAAENFVASGILTQEQLNRLVSYDMRFWTRRFEDDGGWLLCGHVHTAWKQLGKMINIGVDVWDFKPVSMEELEAVINNG